MALMMWLQATATAYLSAIAFGRTASAAQDPDTFYSALRPCPQKCSGTPEEWTLYNSVDRLQLCDQPMLLDFAIYSSLGDSSKTVRLRTCTAGNSDDTQNGLLPIDGSTQRRGTNNDTSSCLAASETKVNLDLSVSNDIGLAGNSDVQEALQHMQTYMSTDIHCDTKFLAGYSKHAVIGVFSGTAVDNSRTLPAVLQKLKENVVTANTPSSVIAQLCGDGRNADQTFGIAIDTNGDLAAVQQAVRAWSDGTCYNNTHQTGDLADVSIYETPFTPIVTNATTWSNVTANASTLGVRGSHQLQARADCKPVSVVSGDSCASLATKCGIVAADFTKYNPSSTLCSGLTVGQRVCCSSGTLPDITPKQNANGTCATYTVKPDDYCAVIAASNGISQTQLNGFNNGVNGTWGWMGCDNLFAGINICLSKGTPPLPAPVANAVCGPTVSGTGYPNSTTTMSNLNPCPLNTCCDVWGQCGMTPEYCTVSLGPTKNPGTAPTGVNGCVSNCGTNITNNQSPPQSFVKVGYYESWNWDRPCLNYRAMDMGLTGYTHAHWGFATIGPGFTITINDTYNQLADFLDLPMKTVISFGGWGYSTDPATYNMLRSAVDPANVDTFVTNIVNFISTTSFDGVDIDWEYPGAPDIPGIPAGLKTDGPNYLAFLKKLRAKLPSGKTMSIAAPASYWYLRAFPIAEMAKQLDYIVYMTYDLHGQWDYSNQWSQDGCAGGNCLRSHVNLTETMYTLAMITKAGVPSNKVTVGVSSYGRSFGMSNARACHANLNNPACTFTGPLSGATPGECTVTAGYISNAEINELIALNGTTTLQVFDAASDTDMVFYGNTWVSFMTDTTKDTRTDYYQSLNFAGTVDWAVDLQNWSDNDQDPDSDSDDDLDPTDPLAPCNDNYATLDALDAAAGSVPDHCVPIYTLIALKGLLTETLNNYTDMIAHNYDAKFKTYASAVADSSGSSMRDFVNQNGNKYFTCQVGELSICCSECNNNKLRPSYCDYCFPTGACYKSCSAIGCSSRRGEAGWMEEKSEGYENNTIPTRVIQRDDVAPQQVLVSTMTKVPEPCPPDYSKAGYGPDDPYESSIWWTLVNDTGFYADLETNTGIPKSKTKIDNYDRGNDCAPSVKFGSTDDCWYIGYDYNIPVTNGYSASDVANPKDVVSKGLDRAKDLGPQIDAMVTQLRLDSYAGDGTDLVDSVSMPIFMLASATENMGQVDDVADKIDDAKKKAFILAFLSAIFLIIPVIGEVASAVAEVGDIAAITALIGTAGNAAMDIYTIVDDKDNAPLAIFDLILAPLALADIAKVAKAAQFRRVMDDASIAKLGGKVKARMDSIEKIKGNCIAAMVEDV